MNKEMYSLPSSVSAEYLKVHCVTHKTSMLQFSQLPGHSDAAPADLQHMPE